MSQGIGIAPLDDAAILIVRAAALGFPHSPLPGLPQSVGLTVMGALASLIVIGIDRLLPTSTVGEDVSRFTQPDA